jgi:hypothetical protein
MEEGVISRDPPRGMTVAVFCGCFGDGWRWLTVGLTLALDFGSPFGEKETDPWTLATIKTKKRKLFESMPNSDGMKDSDDDIDACDTDDHQGW